MNILKLKLVHCTLILFMLLMPFLASSSIATHGAADGAGFSKLMNDLLNEDETLKISQSQIRQAEEAKTQKFYMFLPDLTASASKGREGDPTTDLTAQELTSTLNLTRFGADLLQYDSAQKKYQAQLATTELTFLEAEDVYANLLFDFIAASKQTVVAKRNQKAREDFYQIAQKRFEQGYLSKQELEKVQIDLANAQAKLSDAELAKSQLQIKILGLLKQKDLDWSQLADWPWMQEITKSNVVPILDEQALLASHPATRAVDLSLQSASELEKSASRGLFPSIDLSASYQWAQTRSEETRGWTSFVTLTMPIFNRRQDYSAYRLAVENRIQSEQYFSKAKRELLEQKKSSEVAYQKQRESALAREKILSVSQRLYDDNVRRFQAGRASVNDLLLDQDRLNQAELLAVEGWRSAHASRSALFKSRGLRLLSASSAGF